MPLMVFSSGSELAEDEEVAHESGCAVLWLGGASQGEGLLRVTDQRVLWVSSGSGGTLAAGAGYAFDYPYITMHAICRDASSFDRPCIYCQLGTEPDEDTGAPTEMRLEPANVEELDPIFKALSECAALYPDADEEDDDSEGEAGGIGDEWITSSSQLSAVALSAQQEKTLNHLESVFVEPPAVEGQFDDADESDTDISEPAGPPPPMPR